MSAAPTTRLELLAAEADVPAWWLRSYLSMAIAIRTTAYAQRFELPAQRAVFVASADSLSARMGVSA